MKKKIFISAFLIGALSFALSTSTKAKDAPTNYCDGYKWVTCSNSGKTVIRCTCDGGATCYASWQELC